MKEEAASQDSANIAQAKIEFVIKFETSGKEEKTKEDEQLPAEDEDTEDDEVESPSFQGVVIDQGPKKVVRDVSIKQPDPVKIIVSLVSETGVIKVIFSRPIVIQLEGNRHRQL